MTWARRWSPALTIASLAAGTALGVAGWAAWRALVIAPSSAALPTRSGDPLPVIAVRAPTPPALRRVAVEADPFRPERAPPAVAFRLPKEEADVGGGLPADRPGLVLVGTAVLPGNRGFALCQVPGEAPKLVRLGEQAFGYTLKTVAPGSATFLTAAGATLNVQVPRPGGPRAN